ncbi:peroxidase, FMP-type [Candidatus Albibeggiatoa sp. nov. NOAA]|uniref:peroxidase, FMP-type n=1 Tax=Candidatus Albibeggiatoa sp. nov. NOAA TaxID=3162724 RepID=UPI0032FB6578|nr:peroxidase, FMP-type [Thiotrichaceae bacterium]
MKRPPKYTPNALTEPANYGVLKQLEGVWVNHNPTNNKTGWGLHTTCMPSPGTNSEMIPGKFHFLCENYTEELTFTLVPDRVRNRGGTNEQFCDAVKYSQSIKDLKGKRLHEENGMYLWLNTIYNHPADEESVATDLGKPELCSRDGSHGPDFKPFYSVSRSGTIPHGSTIQLIGHDDPKENGKPHFPHGVQAWDFDHLAISPSMGCAGTCQDNNPMYIDLDKPNPPILEQYTKRILTHELYPYSVRPDLRLRDAIKDQNIIDYVFIHMATIQDGGAQGGIINTPFVQKFTPVTEMQFRMWIETVIEDGKKIFQLQYEQIQYFEFHFGSNGETTRWPHIQINTLRKKE